MRQILISAIVAAAVSALVLLADDAFDREDEGDVASAAPVTASPAAPAEAPTAAPALSYTDALVEDVWINAARASGSDRRVLTDSSSSICYLTKIELKGVAGPEDSSSCLIEIDDFTGFWSLVATVEEGGRAEVRCNARCLVWDQEVTQ